MADGYDGNGDFSYESASDFNKHQSGGSLKSDDETEENNPMSEKVNDYLKELVSEKFLIDKKYPHADRLLDQEISKTQQSGRLPHRDLKYVDIYREKPVRVTVKVLVPVKEHPKFNFVGKLLGPKGNSMRRLQEETMCKMAVLGRGSMKDRKKEEELRASLDPKYLHLNDELHVEISALAPPAEAHARAAYALAEVRKYLIPDSNDNIRQEQIREMIADGTIPAESVDNGSKPPYHKPRVATSHPVRSTYPAHSYGGRRVPGPQHSPSDSVRTVMPAKQKILSILDRARNAMEESYGGYEEIQYEPAPAPHYETYSYSHGHAPPQPVRAPRYDGAEYEPTKYVREYYHREPTAHPVKTSHSSSGIRPSWKSGYPSSRDEESGSKHSHGHSRDSRYRNSPYARPEKSYTTTTPPDVIAII